MLTEPAPNEACDRLPTPLDVVVLVVPESAPPARLIEAIAQACARERNAVLVVLRHRSDDEPPGRRRDDFAVDDDDRLDALWRSRCTRR